MDKIIIDIDKSLLVSLLKKHTVQIGIGYTPFQLPVINARTLFEDDLHSIANCTKDEFITYVNSLSSNDKFAQSKYQRIPEVDILFNNVEFETVFREMGKEVLNGDPCIRYNRINKVIDLK